MKSNPKRLEPFVKAYKLQRKMKDEEMWLQGQYFNSALVANLSHLFGKHSTAKYLEKPILQLHDQEDEGASGESKENVAIIEMKQRIRLLEKQGLPQSPI